MSWPRRLALHVAAAVGATAIFVGAVSVGAQQQQQGQQQSAVSGQQSPVSSQQAAVSSQRVRSVGGTIREVTVDRIVVQTARGRVWQVSPLAGALIRLNGRTTQLRTLAAGDRVVILGLIQDRDRFQAYAITARRPR